MHVTPHLSLPTTVLSRKMTTQNIVVRKLESATDEQIERMTFIMTTAMKNDPFVNAACAGEYATHAPQFFRSQIKAALVGGQVYVAGFSADDIGGAAVWFSPGQELLDSPEQLAAGWMDFVGALPANCQKWWMEYLFPQYGALTTSALGEGAKKASWHLQQFSVLPEYHRRGLGKALVEVVEKQAAKTKAIISVETETQLNVDIYKRLGFVVRGETPIKSSVGDCTMWCLSKTT